MILLILACADVDSAGKDSPVPAVDCDLDGDGFCTDDCADSDAAVHPGAIEECDSIDNNCDGVIDEGAPTWHPDADGDAFGDPFEVTAACHAPEGWIDDGSDCDDADANVHPDAEDVCFDEIDADCDGIDGVECPDCTIFVPDDVPTIQEGIDASVDGDVVCVLPGTYTENLDLGAKAITLLGTAGSAETVLDAGGVAAGILVGGAMGVTIEGLTVRNGVGFLGGGIAIEESLATLRDLVLEDNTAGTEGGGIGLISSGVDLEDIKLRDNFALANYGGGLYAAWSDVSIVGLQAEGNSATNGGGAITLASSNTQAEGLELVGNDAATSGGALVATGGTLALTDANIEDNDVGSGLGGGLYLQAVIGSVRDVRLHGNTAGDGGGAYVNADGFVLERVEMEGNEADYFGGGLELSTAECQLTDVLLANNRSGNGGALYSHLSSYVGTRLTVQDNQGAGIYVDGGAPTISQAIVTGNGGGGSTAAGILVMRDGDLWLEHSLVAGNETGIAAYSGAVTLRHVGLAGNAGGAVALYAAAGTLDHIVVADTTFDCGGCTTGAVLASSGATVSVTRSVIQGTVAGGGICSSESEVNVSHTDNWDNESGDYLGVADQTGLNGNLSVDPMFLDLSAPDPLDWDLHLDPSSPVLDAADDEDPDGSPGQLGLYGGAATWDLDGDGWPSWWLPGPYDAATSPTSDCDDRDATVFPGAGC